VALGCEKKERMCNHLLVPNLLTVRPPAQYIRELYRTKVEHGTEICQLYLHIPNAARYISPDGTLQSLSEIMD
jgi:hypothetical protein